MAQPNSQSVTTTPCTCGYLERGANDPNSPFIFDETVNEDDSMLEKNGVKLLIDSMSYQYLVGAEIDYKEDLEGAQFVIKNPNAQSTCGCGSSFSV